MNPISSRPTRFLSFFCFAFCLLAAPGLAGAKPADGDDPLPWLYENSDVPVDKSWVFGELDNGLRYAVKRNGVPPGQVSIRMRMDVGSLMEAEREQGFAHFMEHLTFRGSTHVPDGEAKRVWQRLGATFGSDSNAETSPTQTVYKLDLPDANRTSLDESLKILSGMASSPGLSITAVNAERPVVLAELRERAGPQSNVQNATRELFFAGQLLASRAPIGTPETLSGATPQMLQLFHQRWYRPEKTVIVIAGDGDPELFEELLKKHFAGWSGKGEAGSIPDFGQPRDTKDISEIIVEPNVPQFISMMIARPWEQVEDTIAYNQQILIDLLAMQMINRRLEARARAGGSYLQASVGQDDVSRSVDGTFISIIPLGEDWEAGQSSRMQRPSHLRKQILRAKLPNLTQRLRSVSRAIPVRLPGNRPTISSTRSTFEKPSQRRRLRWMFFGQCGTYTRRRDCWHQRASCSPVSPRVR